MNATVSGVLLRFRHLVPTRCGCSVVVCFQQPISPKCIQDARMKVTYRILHWILRVPFCQSNLCASPPMVWTCFAHSCLPLTIMWFLSLLRKVKEATRWSGYYLKGRFKMLTWTLAPTRASSMGTMISRSSFGREGKDWVQNCICEF